MIYTIDIDLKNIEAVKLFDFLKTLNYLKIYDVEDALEVPKWQQELVLKRLDDHRKKSVNASKWDDFEKELNAM